MEKKDILFFVLLFVFSGISLYMRYMKKKKTGIGGNKTDTKRKGGLTGQPDDYEPYSGK